MAMRSQVDRKKPHRRTEREDLETDAADVHPSASNEKLVDEMDEILDEIDSILEENAAEFVSGYVQKGGE